MTKSRLLLWAGILAILFATINFIAFMVLYVFVVFYIESFGWFVEEILGAYPLKTFSVVVAVGLAVTGAIMAFAGKKNLAPWFLLGAFFTEWSGFLLFGWALIEDITVSTSDVYEWVNTFGSDITLIVGSAGLLAAIVLSLISFFRKTETSPTSRSDKGVLMNEQVPHEIPAGWYPDPDGKPADRYWNGNAWGTETRPSMATVGPPAPAPIAPPAPAADPDSKPADRSSIGSARVAHQQKAGATKNGMGVAALVLGIIGVVLPMVFFVFSALALLFGSVGLGRVNRGEATNQGVATAGVVLGIIGLVISALLALFYLASP